jgi:eukaryotic-like serine/threonine-protein kinase
MVRKIWLVFIIGFIGNQVFPQATVSWPIFRGSQQLTGYSKTELPDQPKLLWTFQTGDNIKSAPVT